MAANDKTDAARPSGRSSRKSDNRRSGGGRGLGDGEASVGTALRTVYDTTVSEAIPAEMLDLLGKLS